MPNTGKIPCIDVDDAEGLELMREGKWGNASLYRFRTQGHWRVCKGFGRRAFWVRWTFGVFLTRREFAILRRLAGIAGVPSEARRCCPYSLCYRYIEGETVGTVSGQKGRLPVAFFIKAEKLLAEMHDRKVAHLDLRRGTNWLVRPGNKPAIIDFQSAILVGWLPGWLRRRLYDIDRSGLYKFWDRLCDEPLGPERQALLARINRVRKFWVLRGYAFEKARKRKAAK